MRIALGFLFLYAGIAKLMDPTWTSAGYLKGAKSLTGLYQWLAAPQHIMWVDLLNEWGLFLLGAALVLGFATRIASLLAILLMALYYMPVLNFPYAGLHAYIVDEHIIYITGFLVLIAFHAGRQWSIDSLIERSRKAPIWLKKLL